MTVTTRRTRRGRTTRTTRLVAALACAGLVGPVAACAQGGPGTPAPPVTRADVDRAVVTVADERAVPDVVAATHELGRTLLATAPGENTVVSPASLVVALSMLADGARGQTAQHLDDALGAAGAERADAVNALLAEVEVYDGDPAAIQDEELPERPLVHVANQVVLDDEARVHDDYLEALAAGYGAGVLHTDLGSAAGLAPLDAWVQHHTGGLVEGSAIGPDPLLRLVLQNAVLLAARWESPFEESSSGPRPFTLASGDEVQADAMQQTAVLAYAEEDGWRAARLPYTEAFHADVVLPPEGVDPASLPAATAAALRDALDDDAAYRHVDLTLPTVDLDAAPLDLEPALRDAGLGDLFDGPDLGGVSDDDLELAQAWQQAVLEVDEDGTVAAAVTELGIGAASAEATVDAVELVVDRPYLFSVSHTETSWALFTAAIRDPRR